MGKRHDKSSAEAPEQHQPKEEGRKQTEGGESSLQGGREGAVPAKSESGERSTFPKKEDGKAAPPTRREEKAATPNRSKGDHTLLDLILLYVALI